MLVAHFALFTSYVLISNLGPPSTPLALMSLILFIQGSPDVISLSWAASDPFVGENALTIDFIRQVTACLLVQTRDSKVSSMRGIDLPWFPFLPSYPTLVTQICDIFSPNNGVCVRRGYLSLNLYQLRAISSGQAHGAG